MENLLLIIYVNLFFVLTEAFLAFMVDLNWCESVIHLSQASESRSRLVTWPTTVARLTAL